MSSVLPIEEDLRYRIINASTGQTQFAISFPFQQDEDITVALGGSPGVWQALSPTLYDVSGAGEPAGGMITFHAGRADGERILVLGEAILDRLGSIVADGRFNSKLTDDELDRNRLIQQETAREAARALKMDFGAGGGLTVVNGIADGRTLMKDGDRLVPGPDIVAEADRAERAREIAAGYLNDLVSEKEVPITATRDGMAFIAFPAGMNSLETRGYRAMGDGGGALYARVSSEPSHALKIRSLDRYLPDGSDDEIDGGWWEIVAKGVIDARCAGVVADSDGSPGNGTDNAAALQAAIDFIAPFIWRGTTRLTELQGSASGTVILPKGIIRFASKIKLNPNLILRGQATGNDFTVRTGIGGAAAGLERMGAALFADIDDPATYALDTCPYSSEGVRLSNTTMVGGDSYNGVKTQVPNVRLESLTIYGNWTCKGINFAGAESCYIAPDVLIRGFIVGVRLTAAWYAKMAGRILYSWRGIIAWMAATDVDVSGASFWRPVEAPVYDPTIDGWDGTEPAQDAWWTVEVLKRSAAIFNFYGNVVGTNIAVELGDYQFMSKNGVADIRGIYTENTQHGIIFTEGPDQQNEHYAFDTITTSSAPLLFSKNARLEVEALHHNYTQSGFGYVIGDIFNTLGYEAVPVLNGLKLTAEDATNGWTDTHAAYGGLREYHGAWTPSLLFGGAAADDGTGLGAGRWLRIGNRVFVQGRISVGSLTAATGDATIDGLPFRIRNFFGFDACLNISFFFGTPPLRVGRGVAGGYSVVLDGITHSGFTNDTELRFQMDYETDEGGHWGW